MTSFLLVLLKSYYGVFSSKKVFQRHNFFIFVKFLVEKLSSGPIFMINLISVDHLTDPGSPLHSDKKSVRENIGNLDFSQNSTGI